MRNWRLPEDTIISDGNIPINGRLPAFISSMIMIKNVRYQYKSTPPNTNSQVLSLLGDRPIVNVIKEINIDLPKIDISIGGLRGPDNGLYDPLPDGDLRHPRDPVEDIPDLGRINGRISPIGDVMDGPMEGRIRDSVWDVISPGDFTSISRPEMFEGDHRVIIHTEDAKVESVTSEDYSFDEAIYVIAFVCQRVPKSPNPDLNLSW